MTPGMYCRASRARVLFLKVSSSLMPADKVACLREESCEAGGSVGCLVDKWFKSTFIPSTSYYSFEHIITSSRLNLTLSVFTAPRTNPPKISLKIYQDLLSLVSSPHNTTLITGDFNIHMDTDNSDSKTKKYCQITIMLNMSDSQLINSATL